MSPIDHLEKEKEFVGLRQHPKAMISHGFDKKILSRIEKLCPNARKIYMGGNHEQWAELLVSQSPSLQEMLEPEYVLRLKERKWEWIPYLVKQYNGGIRRGILKIGKLTFVHGEYTNKYHANKTSETFMKSTLYAHTHDLQLITKVTVEDPNDFHTCQSIGCLCDRSPQFLWGKPNRWVHSFGIVYFQDNGNFNVLVANGYKIIIHTSRAWNEYDIIEKWLDDWKIPHRRIVCGKLFAKYYIDDRNIEFNGSWEKVYKKIR